MLLDDFARYSRFEAARSLPDEVSHHAKRALIDWFASLLPGTAIAPATNLMHAHRLELGYGRSSLPGCETTAFPALAAWINGAASHAIEFDDIFRDAIYHPGCPTIGAALAVAEDQNKSGRDLLRAITVGYEISTRIGVAVQPSHYRYFHTTGTIGCFGSSAAVAMLLAPADGEVMRHALASAGSMAAGLQQAFRSDAMTKALHAGHAASVGVLAGMGAASGVTGALDILEGAAGFGAAMAVNPQWDKATEALGTRYNIQHITQKNHGCCGHTFAAIDAALELREQLGGEVRNIRSIAVDAYQIALDVCGNADPQTAFEARFSLAYVVCHALLHGSVRLDAFSPERLADRALRTLMQTLQLRADPELSAKFPVMRAARLRIVLDDGRAIEHFAPYRKGDPEAPLSDAELDDKFRELASPVIGSASAQKLLGQLWNLDRLNVADLRLAELRNSHSATHD
ncbi:MAG: MmgE/PrpD family protein [Betaproteobacteria bacterium]